MRIRGACARLPGLGACVRIWHAWLSLVPSFPGPILPPLPPPSTRPTSPHPKNTLPQLSHTPGTAWCNRTCSGRPRYGTCCRQSDAHHSIWHVCASREPAQEAMQEQVRIESLVRLQALVKTRQLQVHCRAIKIPSKFCFTTLYINPDHSFSQTVPKSKQEGKYACSQAENMAEVSSRDMQKCLPPPPPPLFLLYYFYSAKVLLIWETSVQKPDR